MYLTWSGNGILAPLLLVLEEKKESMRKASGGDPRPRSYQYKVSAVREALLKLDLKKDKKMRQIQSVGGVAMPLFAGTARQGGVGISASEVLESNIRKVAVDSETFLLLCEPCFPFGLSSLMLKAVSGIIVGLRRWCASETFDSVLPTPLPVIPAGLQNQTPAVDEDQDQGRRSIWKL
jgi:hypothetical protein